MNHIPKRRYRKRPDRRVWIFSELNHDLRPEQIAKILTAAGLDQARLEAEAAQAYDQQHAHRDPVEPIQEEAPDA